MSTPEIQDDEGSADEWFARCIIATIPITLLFISAGFVIGVINGMVTFDVVIEGVIDVSLLVKVAVGLVVLTYVMSMAKEWGLTPIAWIKNAATDYQPK